MNQAWNRLDPHIQEDPVPESAIKDLVTILEGVNDQRFNQANGPQTRFDPLPILFGDLSELGGPAGEAAVVSAIYNFRKALTDVLRTQVSVEADNQTIVFSGGTGYRFSDSITVRDARNTVPVQAPEVETSASRRELILTLLRQSGKMRSTNIASELGCSLKTVKRELDTLRLAGHIEFVGPSKTGTYRLVGA